MSTMSTKPEMTAKDLIRLIASASDDDLARLGRAIERAKKAREAERSPS